MGNDNVKQEMPKESTWKDPKIFKGTQRANKPKHFVAPCNV